MRRHSKCYPGDQLTHHLPEWFVRQPRRQAAVRPRTKGRGSGAAAPDSRHPGLYLRRSVILLAGAPAALSATGAILLARRNGSGVTERVWRDRVCPTAVASSGGKSIHVVALWSQSSSAVGDCRRASKISSRRPAPAPPARTESGGRIQQPVRSCCWSSLTEAALRLPTAGERCAELAPPVGDGRRPLRLSNEQRRGHDPGSSFEILPTDSRISSPGHVHRFGAPADADAPAGIDRGATVARGERKREAPPNTNRPGRST